MFTSLLLLRYPRNVYIHKIWNPFNSTASTIENSNFLWIWNFHWLHSLDKWSLLLMSSTRSRKKFLRKLHTSCMIKVVTSRVIINSKLLLYHMRKMRIRGGCTSFPPTNHVWKKGVLHTLGKGLRLAHCETEIYKLMLNF